MKSIAAYKVKIIKKSAVRQDGAFCIVGLKSFKHK